MNDAISNFALIITTISAFSLIWVSAALTNKKERAKVKEKLKNMTFFHKTVRSSADFWSSSFEFFFGEKFFSKRQILTIPLYTLAISGLLIGAWIAYLYVFKNPTHSFSAQLPLEVKQAISDFYTKGIFSALLIDFIAISLTKLSIKIGRKNDFKSLSFLFTFLLTFIFVFFIFSVVTYYFRVEDMVHLYINFAPQDEIPIIPFTPLQNILSSDSLVAPQTLIHFTSSGVMTTYFMPEPVIFYCAVVAQLSLIFIFLSYQLSNVLLYIKNTCIKFVSAYGTPESGAFGVIGLVISSFLILPIFFLCIYVLTKN